MRPKDGLDLWLPDFHISGGKIHKLANHPISLMNTDGMLIENMPSVKSRSGYHSCQLAIWAFRVIRLYSALVVGSRMVAATW